MHIVSTLSSQISIPRNFSPGGTLVNHLLEQKIQAKTINGKFLLLLLIGSPGQMIYQQQHFTAGFTPRSFPCFLAASEHEFGSNLGRTLDSWRGGKCIVCTLSLRT